MIFLKKKIIHKFYYRKLFDTFAKSNLRIVKGLGLWTVYQGSIDLFAFLNTYGTLKMVQF